MKFSKIKKSYWSILWVKVKKFRFKTLRSIQFLPAKLWQIFLGSGFICIDPSNIEMRPKRRRRLAYPVDMDLPALRDTDDVCLLFLSPRTKSRNNHGVKRFLLGVLQCFPFLNKFGYRPMEQNLELRDKKIFCNFDLFWNEIKNFYRSFYIILFLFYFILRKW